MFGLPAVNEVGEVFTFYFKSVFPYIMPVIYPVGMIAQTGSVYLGSKDRSAGFMELMKMPQCPESRMKGQNNVHWRILHQNW